MKNLIPIALVAMLGIIVYAATNDIEPKAACGLGGLVYNSQGQLAGSQLHNIVVKRTDATGDASYSYDSGTSEYRINCETGLVTGYWHAYAVTNENGQYRYSDWCPTFYWYPHVSNGTHDFHCTRLTPPPNPEEQE